MGKIRIEAPQLSGIRQDHIERYKFAAEIIELSLARDVIDIGCGVGYGLKVMEDYFKAEEDCVQVKAIDSSEYAINYAIDYYQTDHSFFEHCDAAEYEYDDHNHEFAILFEVIQYIKEPSNLLKKLSEKMSFMCGSVPNRNFFFLKDDFVVGRNEYNPAELKELLESSGWVVDIFGHQKDRDGDKSVIYTGDPYGQTIVFACQSKNFINQKEENENGESTPQD